MKVLVLFRTRYAMANKRILVDSGATDNFIHPKFVKQLCVGMQELQWLKKVSQCLAIFERMTWHKSGKLCNILNIMYVIVHHLGFLTSPRSRDLD